MKKALMFLLGMSVLESVSSQTIFQQELLVNSDFSKNTCLEANERCILNQPNQIDGWIPNPQIQMPHGRFYNSRLSWKRVVQLVAGTQNSCLYQKAKNLTPGIYRLEFEYAARDGKTFEDCQFKVEFNKKELKRITPTNSNVNTEFIDFEVKQTCEGEVQFCGINGPKSGNGAILKFVSLIRKGDIPQAIVPRQIIPPPSKLYAISLDSHSDRCLENKFQFPAGQLYLNFDYKVPTNLGLQESALYVTLNQQPIFKLLPFQSGKSVRLSGNIDQGIYRIGFCALGSQYEIPHTVTVSNFVASLRQCTGGWGNNDLIVNGGFEQNECGSQICFWNRENGKGKVKGWQANPEIQVGKAKTLHGSFAEGWALELQGQQNTCTRQKVALKPGKHSLRFEWAGRQNLSSWTTEFQVKVNEKILKTLLSLNKKVNNEVIEFELTETPTESWIEFCGTGPGEERGIVIDNVQLFSYNSCASEKITQYN